MLELEQEDPIPQGDLALQITALPRETNGFGDIFGGWLVSQMDLAGTAMASKVAGGRVATVAIDRMAFLVPVAVGAQLSFYTEALEIGRSSIQMMVEVWSDDPLSSEWRKVTEAVFVFVADNQASDFLHPEKFPGWAERYRPQMQYEGFGRALYRSRLNLASTDFDAIYATIARNGTPVQLIWGKQDPVIPVAQAARIRRAIPALEYFEIDQAGHLPQMEQTAIFNQRMLAYLEAHPS